MKPKTDRQIGPRAAKEIRRMCKETGVSITEEMQRLGACRLNLYAYEHGKQDPCADTLRDMWLCGYDVIYILTGERSGA